MNKKIDIINETFNSRIMAPTIPPPPLSTHTLSASPFVTPLCAIPLSAPPTSSIKDGQYVHDELRNKKEMEQQICSDFIKPTNNNYVVDNNVLYNKLLNLENEIKALKNMIGNINNPKSTYYQTQTTSYGAPHIPMSHNINSHINIKPNQPNYL